jgi:hypothetical protein
MKWAVFVLRETSILVSQIHNKGDRLLEVRELPKNNLCILLALLPVFYVVTTST